MEVIRQPEEMQERALEWKRAGVKIGFVPTMGYLHEGHLSLIRQARGVCDKLVVSIFVNPSQFGESEDLGAYPRDFERDERLCREAGVDLIFYPTAETMYAPDASIWVVEEQLSRGLCGASRPGHFRGVCTVVAKLFNLVLPDLAVFGEKDAQQLRIIERMVRDLNFSVKILRGPIVREEDGVAMSSRNTYLSAEERVAARCLSKALLEAQSLVTQGERRVEVLRQRAEAIIKKEPLAQIDYIDFVDDETLEPVNEVGRPVLMALAVRFGSTRLIDNIVLRV